MPRQLSVGGLRKSAAEAKEYGLVDEVVSSRKEIKAAEDLTAPAPEKTEG